MIESTTERPYSGSEKCKCGKPAVIEINIPPFPPWYRCVECEERFKREIKWQYLGEHSHEDNIICPYCGDEKTGYWDVDSDVKECECGECGRKFDIEVQHSVTYSTKRSLCEMPPDWNEEGDDE